MSDKTQLFNPDKLSIIDFKLVKGQVDTPEDFSIEKVSGHHLENSLEIGFNLEDKLVKTDFKVDIKTDSKEDTNKKEAEGKFHFVFIFKVENLIDLAIPDSKGMIEVNPVLANALSSITYSTSRGILLTRLQGTAFQNFILPIINPNNLLSK